MKKIIITLLLPIFTCTMAFAQSQEVAQLLLNVEKLAQLKQILSDMKTGYQVVSKGYGTIKNLTEGNFDLHKAFLDGLMEVSPVVRKYKKVSDIIGYQILLVKEYKTAFSRFQESGQFNEAELKYLSRTYDNLFKQSLKNIEALTMVVTAGKMRMSDSERINAIDEIYADMQDKLGFLRHFNKSNLILTAQRERATVEVKDLKGIYGIEN